MSNNALNTFYQEANELLLSLEDSLLLMEQNPSGKDAVNSAFRSIHTIKGSSGMFGLEHIENFAHHMEQLLDCIRRYEIPLDEKVIALLLSCKDHLDSLVKTVLIGVDPDTSLKSKSASYIDDINSYVNRDLAPPAPDQTEATKESNQLQPNAANQSSRASNVNWHISIRFAEDVLKRGMDPVSILKYLANFGSLVNVTTLWNQMPTLEELDPESCYPGLEIELNSDCPREEIETAFEFINKDCVIYMIPPGAELSMFSSLMANLPETSSEIAAVLVESNVLTAEQADIAISLSPAPANSICIGEQRIAMPKVTKYTNENTGRNQGNTQQADSQLESHSLEGNDQEKLDSLINLVGELVISGATTQLLGQQVGNEDLMESISRMGRLIEEIRDSVLSRRMVEIGELYKQFEQLLATANQSNDKSISLDLNGASTELEIAIFEKITGPFLRLMNSVLATVDNRETRVLSELNPTVNLTVDAYHDSGSIVIELLDDGNCLPIQQITEYALAKHLFDADTNIANSEIYRLVIESNIMPTNFDDRRANHLLTIQQVKKNVEALRGTLELDTVDARTTLIRIRLPLTLAIIDGFLVGVGKSSYVVPLDMVIECVELEQVEEHMNKSQSYINLRGEVLPFLRLRELFHESREQNVRENIVVVEYGGAKAGLVVDSLLGEVQTVIKPLGKILQNLKGICGATILGSGNVAVIIDVPNLIQRAAFSTELHVERGDSIH